MTTSTIEQHKPAINLRPRDRFKLSNQSISSHRDLVSTREFERGADFSLLEYASLICERDFASPAVIGLKLMGAIEFLQTMRTLGETATLPAPLPKRDNLDHSL